MNEKQMRILVAGVCFAAFWAILLGMLGHAIYEWPLPALLLRAVGGGLGLGLVTVVVLSVVAPIAEPNAEEVARDDRTVSDLASDVVLGRGLAEVVADGAGEGSPWAGARELIREGKRARTRGALAGALGALGALAVAVLVLLNAGRGARVGGEAWALLGLAGFVFQLVSNRFANQPRLVVVLRRFRSYEDGRVALAAHVGEACRGLAVPITIQDESFPGGLPLGLQALRRFVLWPATVGLPVVAVVALGQHLGPAGAVVLWASLAALLWVLGSALLRRVAVFRATEESWEETVRGLVAQVRARRGIYSGTRVMRFPDAVWKDAIELALREADAVVLDASEISENVAWEVGTTFRLVPPERVLLAYTRAADDDGSPALPERVARPLRRLVPDVDLARCPSLGFPEREGGIASVLLADMLQLELARCLAADREEPVPASAGQG